MKPNFPAQDETVADLIFHLARRAASAGPQTDLTPAQWAALRYFARANRLSRTPSAFASFHATTRGTASQTVKSLVDMGHLSRQACGEDGRSVHFQLTETGEALLAHDPLSALARALGHLSDTQRNSLVQALQTAIVEVAAARQVPAFGSCGTCSHLTPANDVDMPAPEPVCACTGQALEPQDFERLCIRFDATAVAETPDDPQ